MARKKKVKKKATRKSKRSSMNQSLKLKNVSRKIALVINNLVLFVIFSLAFFILYQFGPAFFQDVFLKEFLFVLAMVFGFVAVGFLIVLLVLYITKIASKK